MIRRSATHVVERDRIWSGEFATEPWEAGWATEAVFFVRRLGGEAALSARVQISPDGIRWVDEGGTLDLPSGTDLAFVRVREFGGWLRLTGSADGGQARVIAYLSLKG